MRTRARRETATSSRWMRTRHPSRSRSRTCHRRTRRPGASSRSRLLRPCASLPRLCGSERNVSIKELFRPEFRCGARGAPMTTIMDYVSRGVFGLASIVLMLIALALSVYSAGLIFTSLAGPWSKAGHELLESVGYVVIAMAVFDVAKYFMEEEVIRAREMRLASEARRSLTKFISAISIAVFIEGLVLVFRQSREDIGLLLYPSAVLVTGIGIILGLGIYQRLSAEAESQVEARDIAAENDGDGREKRSGRAAASRARRQATSALRNVTLRAFLLRCEAEFLATQYARYQSRSPA